MTFGYFQSSFYEYTFVDVDPSKEIISLEQTAHVFIAIYRIDISIFKSKIP